MIGIQLIVRPYLQISEDAYDSSEIISAYWDVSNNGRRLKTYVWMAQLNTVIWINFSILRDLLQDKEKRRKRQGKDKKNRTFDWFDFQNESHCSQLKPYLNLVNGSLN